MVCWFLTLKVAVLIYQMQSLWKTSWVCNCESTGMAMLRQLYYSRNGMFGFGDRIMQLQRPLTGPQVALFEIGCEIRISPLKQIKSRRDQRRHWRLRCNSSIRRGLLHFTKVSPRGLACSDAPMTHLFGCGVS